MKKNSTFMPLAVLLLTGAFSGPGAASILDDLHGGAPVSALRYSVRLAADGPVKMQSVVGVAGKPVPLDIGSPAGGAQSYRFVMARGLPEAVTLSAGFRVRQAWFIAAKDLDGVQVVPPAGYEGNFMLELFFFKDSQEAPAGSTVVNVQISAADKEDVRGSQTLSAAPPVVLDIDGVKPRSRAIFFSPAQEAEMLGKGEDYMRMGDVAAARLMFEDLAAHGSAKGTLAMGRSFDPNVLKDVMIAGALQPDVNKARLWYQRAADMGDADAASRLKALGTR